MAHKINPSEAARQAFQERLQAERAKAAKKYGSVALEPAGHPDYDVLDYAIGEVVGLHRYGEILMARATAADTYPKGLRVQLHELGVAMQQAANIIGPRAIQTHQMLEAAGLDLGTKEHHD